MASELHTEPGSQSEASLTSLVSGIVNDAQALLKEEIALARSEIREEINKAKEAMISLAAGVVVLAFGAMLLSFMLVYLLWQYTPIPRWGCFAIFGGLFMAAGVGLLLMAKNRAQTINLMPKQTVQTMKENVQWIKNQT